MKKRQSLNLWTSTILFSSMAFALYVYPQNKPTTSKATTIDSTSIPTISLKDLQQFNTLLKKQASYEQYTQLTPEATLAELWKWKIQQNIAAKQLPDSSKKK